MDNRIAAIREALKYGQVARPRSPMFDQALAHLDALEGELKGEPIAYTTQLALDGSRALAGTPFGIIDACAVPMWGEKSVPLYAHPPKAEPPVDIAVLTDAGNALDHKFIDLVAFCAANIPEDKLQDLVDDWAGHDERKAWKDVQGLHG